MALFGDLAQARSRVLDQRDALASQNQVRNDALRQKMIEMALTVRGQNETNRHNVAGETESANQFGETKRHNTATETSTGNAQNETGRHNLVDEAIARLREKREALLANRPDLSPVPGVDPSTGNPTVWSFDKRTGKMTNTGIGKPTPDQKGGTNAPQMAAAKANLESAMKTMDDYEAKLKADPSKYGVMDAAQGSIASSPSALTAQHVWDVPMALGANMASSHLQSSNPELMKYMTAKKYVAEAILNTHKRPNQTQYEIEQELSGIGPHPNPMQIDMASGRRRRMYQEVFGGDNAQLPGPSANAGATTPGKHVPTFEEWKKMKGHQ